MNKTETIAQLPDPESNEWTEPQNFWGLVNLILTRHGEHARMHVASAVGISYAEGNWPLFRQWRRVSDAIDLVADLKAECARSPRRDN